MNELSKAAAILGRKGGQAGTGASKARPNARAAALKRWGDPVVRFWKKVDKRGPDECWPWLGHCINGGYGAFGLGHTKITAHRYAFISTFGEIEKHLDVCHRCDNPPCCNPAHLFAGTTKENIHDCMKKGRWVTCRGEMSGKAKLTKEKVLEIRRLHSEIGISQAGIARNFGVSEGAIAAVLKKRTWRHI